MPPTWESRVRQAAAGKIESAAAVRAKPAEFWAEIRGALTEAGLWQPGAMQRVIGPMWSAAIARRTAYEQFNKAAPNTPFTSNLAAPDMNMRPADIRNLHPEFLVRFDLTFIDPTGEQVTKTVAVRDDWRPGMTVGDVYSAVADAAEGLGMDYGQGVVSYGNLRPVVI